MLNLGNLRTLLSRVLDLPLLHTVVLFTPEGELVCYASEPNKTKDRVRVLVGLSTEIWQETREQNIGMVDCEVRLLVIVSTVQRMNGAIARASVGVTCRNTQERRRRGACYAACP